MPAAAPGPERFDARELAARRSSGRLHRVRGPLAASAWLAALARAHADEVRRDPARLARKLVVVVPSGTLRRHLLGELVRAAGGALVGIDVRTVHALALEVLARAGEAAPAGDALLALLGARRAAAHRPLARALGEHDDGYAALNGTLRDLVDAGLDAGVAPVLDERLAEATAEGALASDVARARALVAAAAEVEAARAELGRTGRAGVLRRATECVRERGDELLGPAEHWIVGFGDATGLVAGLLEALARRASTHVLGSEPFEPLAERPASRFAERLGERLAAVAPSDGAPPLDAPAPRIELVEALGLDAEARHALERAAELARTGIDGAPIAPERIAIVARDLGPYARSLRVHAARLGVPLSGAGAPAPLLESGRRLSALVALLAAREATTVTCLVGAAEPHACAPPKSGASAVADVQDLVLACHALGAGRVDRLAALEVERVVDARGRFALPSRVRARAGTPDAADEHVADHEGSSESAEEDERETSAPESPADDAPAPSTRRHLDRARLEHAVALARGISRDLADWSASLASADEQRARTLGLAVERLGWRAGAALEALEAAAQALVSDLGAATRLGFDEWVTLLARALEDAGREPFGGAGGGVQVLGVMEARGLAFDALLVLGLARDRFPRRSREDPLLPDALRRRLAEILPEMPITARAHDEERHLFAELAAAAPLVVLSRPAVDDDGRELAPSLFFTRLAAPLGPLAVRVAGARDGAGARTAIDRVTATAFEGAIEHGLAGDGRSRDAARRDAWRERVALAWSEARDDRGSAASGAERVAASIASARADLLAALDARAHGTAPEPGPFDGFVGAIRGDDPRTGPLYVTVLERFAECGWRTFLERLLGIAPAPDPLAALPALEPRFVGSLVHRVLERVVAPERRAPDRHAHVALAELVQRAPRDVAWPSPAALDALIAEEADAVAREEGIALPGLVRALAARAKQTLERAREVEWPDGSHAGVLGVEAEGALDVAPWLGRRERLFFRTDRVDRGERAPLLVDYKTGRPKVPQVKEPHRSRRRIEALAAGRLLQGFVYSAATGGRGLYVYLEAEKEAAARLEIDAAEPAQRRAAALALRTLHTAWHAGAFAPRLVEAAPGHEREPKACSYCELSVACVRGDSASRARLVDLAIAGASAGGDEAARAAWRAWLDAWHLPAIALDLSKDDPEAIARAEEAP